MVTLLVGGGIAIICIFAIAKVLTKWIADRWD
jgi:hypothetical protein